MKKYFEVETDDDALDSIALEMALEMISNGNGYYQVKELENQIAHQVMIWSTRPVCPSCGLQSLTGAVIDGKTICTYCFSKIQITPDGNAKIFIGD